MLALALLLQAHVVVSRADLPVSFSRMVAQAVRLWDPKTGKQVALIPWALAQDEVERGGKPLQVDLTLTSHRFGGGHNTSDRRRLTFDSSTSHQSGYFVVPFPPSGMEWALGSQVRGTSRRAGFEGRLPRLPEERTAISDVVIGARGQGLTFSLGDHDLVLAPRELVKRTDWLNLYYQVRSDSANPRVDTRLTFTPMFGEDSAGVDPVLTVGFRMNLIAGINEVERELDVSQLPSSRYRIVVEMTGAGGAPLARQEAMMLLLNGPRQVVITLPPDTTAIHDR